MLAKHWRLNNRSFCLSLPFQVKIAFHEKVANLAQNSITQVLFLENVVPWYAAECELSILSHTVVKICALKGQESKKLIIWGSLAVQWLRLHASTARGADSIPGQGTKILQAAQCGPPKINNFYRFIKDIPRFHFLCFYLFIYLCVSPSFPSPCGDCVAVEYTTVTSAFDAPGLLSANGHQQFYPPWLLHHQCKCQHSKKVRWHLSIIMQGVLTPWTPLKGSWGLPGVCGQYLEATALSCLLWLSI